MRHVIMFSFEGITWTNFFYQIIIKFVIYLFITRSEWHQWPFRYQSTLDFKNHNPTFGDLLINSCSLIRYKIGALIVIYYSFCLFFIFLWNLFWNEIFTFSLYGSFISIQGINLWLLLQNVQFRGGM